MTFVPARMMPDPGTPTPPPGPRRPFVPPRMVPDPHVLAPPLLSIAPDEESIAIAREMAQRLAAFREHLARLTSDSGEED